MIRQFTEIARMQHLDANEMKIRRHEIKIVPDANHIRIGVIGGQHRVLVRPVTLIAPRHDRSAALQCGRGCDRLRGRAGDDQRRDQEKPLRPVSRSKGAHL